MRKKLIGIMTALLMFTLVGCNKASEVNLQEEISGKYMYFNLENKNWLNNKYAYKVSETYIANFTEENAALYSIREKVEGSMVFKGYDLDENGKGITYKFTSNPNNEYKMYVYLDEENNNELKAKLYDPQGNVETVDADLITKEECENKIKNTINEIELENMIENNLGKVANLDLDKIKSDIDKAREVVYKETKEDRDSVYYLYVPVDNYSELNDDKKSYIGFSTVALDEYGEMISMGDFTYLVNMNDFSLYTYAPSENGDKKLEKYEDNSSQVDSNESNNSNTESTNNTQSVNNDAQVEDTNTQAENIEAVDSNTEANADKMPTMAEQKKAMAKIMAEYGPSTEEHQVSVLENPIFYNGEWCYMVATGYKTVTGMDKANQFYVGSKTLQNYGTIPY